MIGRPKREDVSTTITQDRNNRQGLAANPEGSDQTSGVMELADTDGHSAWPNRSKTSRRQGISHHQDHCATGPGRDTRTIHRRTPMTIGSEPQACSRTRTRATSESRPARDSPRERTWASQQGACTLAYLHHTQVRRQSNSFDCRRFG